MSAFIGFRDDITKLYGPQYDEKQVADLFTLLSPLMKELRPAYVFPDLTPVVRHIDTLIRNQFAELRNDELAHRYTLLFNQWTDASTISNPENRRRDFWDVAKEAPDLIIRLQGVFPARESMEKWTPALIAEVESKGRMYAEALLFLITSRAWYDGESLARNTTIPGYCEWLRVWIKSWLRPGRKESRELLLSAALYRTEDYPALQALIEGNIPDSADTYLAEVVRDQRQTYQTGREPLLHIYHRGGPGEPAAMERKLKSVEFPDMYWHMVRTLHTVLYRVDQLQALLQALADQQGQVDFSLNDDVHRQVKEQLAQLVGDGI